MNAITKTLTFALSKYKNTSVRKEIVHLPLQVCGNFCGSSVVVCGCLGAYGYELFRQSADLSSIKYLKNISYYGTFLKVVFMKWFIENNIDIFDIAGEKCKEGSTQTKLHNATPTKRKENGNSSSLHCKRVLSQSRNKETIKKIKPKPFDTESHSSSTSSHPSKFNFSSPLENETEIIQSNLENFKEKNFQKPTQRAHIQFNTSLWDAKFCSKDLKRDSPENN